MEKIDEGMHSSVCFYQIYSLLVFNNFQVNFTCTWGNKCSTLTQALFTL